jgi:hypothetical protein
MIQRRSSGVMACRAALLRWAVARVSSGRESELDAELDAMAFLSS